MTKTLDLEEYWNAVRPSRRKFQLQEAKELIPAKIANFREQQEGLDDGGRPYSLAEQGH